VKLFGTLLAICWIIGNVAHAGSPITVADFVLDGDTYVGKKIEITGIVTCTAGMGDLDCSLIMQGQATTQLDLDVTALPREVRRRMLECGMEDMVDSMMGKSGKCGAIILGQVVKTPIGPSIHVSAVTWW
jgi:hypothetical protein